MFIVIKKIFLSLFFILYASSLLYTQTIQFSQYSIEDGLSQGTILSSLQDKNGFLWFGSADGLNCFNGYEFTVYRNNPENANSLIDNEIMALLEDEVGNIWIGTALGLSKFSPSTQKFTHFQYQEADSSSLSHNYITFLFIDSKKQIWVGTRHGLNLYNPSTNNFTRYYQKGIKDNSSIERQQVNTICQGSKQNIWIGLEDGLCILEDNILKPFEEVYDLNNVRKGQRITAIMCDSADNIWIGSDQTLCRFSLKNNDIELIAEKYIHTLLNAKNGIVWAGTNEGILLIKDKSQQKIYKHTYQSTSLPNNVVHSILEDKHENIWVGTGSGLCMYNSLVFQFNTTRINSFNVHDYTDNKVWAIAPKGKDILIGTENGLYQYNFNDSVQAYSQFSGFGISAIKIQKDVIWLGTWNNGLIKWDTKTGESKQYNYYPSDKTSINHNTIRSIAIDPQGIIWVGTPKGLNSYLPEKDNFERFQFHSTEGQNLKTNSVITIYPDKSGMLWLGTEGGVVCFRKEEGEVNIFRSDPDMPNSLSHDFVRSIYQSKDGTIWIGTSGGLNKWSADKMAFTSYRMKDGLPNDMIYSILEADDGALWLSTNKGLSRFNTKELTFTNFDSKDGLQGSEFNTNAALKDRKGRLFFGGLNGFNHFFPEQIKTNPIPPPVIINYIEILNKTSEKPLRKYIIPDSNLELSYNDYVFTFHFVAQNYINSEKNLYQYMLEGFDLDWSDIGYKRSATYTNLQKGNYTFKVKAANNSKLWNEEISSVKVSIHPPFWLTEWFIALMAFLFMLIIGGIIYLRIRIVEKKNIQLEQLVKDRTASLSEKQKILASREALFRSFYEGSPLGIIYVDGKNAGKIIRCNTQMTRILGYTKEEIISSQMTKYTHRKDLKKKSNQFITAIQNKKELEAFKECRLFKKDGEMIYTNVYISFHYDKDKQLDYIIAMVIDETEDLVAQKKLKKAEEQLIDVNKMAALGQLTAGVAHEINNPVNFIYSGISSLKKNINALLSITSQYDSLQTAEDFIEKKPHILQQKKQIDYKLVLDDIDGLMNSIKNGADRTTEIVKSLQAFSRKDKVRFQRTDIHVGLDATLHLLKKEMIDRIVIEKKYDKNIKEIECFPGQLNQVFLNILLNAVQAIPEKGIISITTRQEQQQVIITIKDNGQGIPPKVLARIFEPFFTTKEVGKGTGLGLSICYNIIKKHNGTIIVDSHQGEGTTFFITLPIYQDSR